MKHRFIFDGTLDEFNAAVEQAKGKGGDLLFSKKDGRYSFGVGRGGHGGGYWYSPSYVERDGKLLIEGKIRPENAPDTKSRKVLRMIEIVLFWYVYLVFFILFLLASLIRALLKKGNSDAPARNLRRLMIEWLGCSTCRKFK